MTIDNVPKEENFSFAKNTTYRCGGTAKIAYFPASIRQATAVFRYLTTRKIKFITLGNGSNVLASDRYFDGAVICTKNLTGIERISHDTIFCRAGTTVGTLLKFCADNGLGGLEYLAGIPATCGGLVYMNGGAGERYVGNDIVRVKIFDDKVRNLSNKSCHFSYKYSTMRDINRLILGAEFKISPTNSEKVRQDIGLYLDKRKHQPKGASCGCVFKNAEGQSAGVLIDRAGLKGLSVGKARVSEEHANFILNGGASSFEVRELIETVRNKVFLATGILLEEEVIYIGDF